MYSNWSYLLHLCENCCLVIYQLCWACVSLTLLSFFLKKKKTLNAAQTIKLIYFPGTLSINTKWQNKMSLLYNKIWWVRACSFPIAKGLMFCFIRKHFFSFSRKVADVITQNIRFDLSFWFLFLVDHMLETHCLKLYIHN